MKSEALEQIKARIAYQKELAANSGGHSHEEEVVEMWKWVWISFMVGFPICVASSVKDVLFEEHHGHDDSPKPDYMAIRNKAYPWQCEDCALFDAACWKKCRTEGA